MLADEAAAHIFAVAPARRRKQGEWAVSLSGNSARPENALAHGVGKGHFRRGNQILGKLALIAATGNVKQVFAEFSAAGRCPEGCCVDDIGGVVLEIAVLQRVGVEAVIPPVRGAGGRFRLSSPVKRARRVRRGSRNPAPEAHPKSTWSFTSKSNVRGVPTLRTYYVCSRLAHRHAFVR